MIDWPWKVAGGGLEDDDGVIFLCWLVFFTPILKVGWAEDWKLRMMTVGARMDGMMSLIISWIG